MFVTATLFLAFFQAKSLSVNISPKPGAFLLAGGGTTTKEMVEEFAKLCGGKDGRILVLAQTREDPTKGASSLTFLKENGFSDPLLIDDKELSVERKKSLEDEFAKAIGFWVPGGNQNLVIERFGQKWFHDNVSLAIKRGANWFGTSAGAMVVSDPMIGGNNPDNSPKIVPGAGLLDVLIDTHFKTRNRKERMRITFHRGKYQMAVGLDEGEWIILRDSQIEKKYGEPMIMLKESRLE
ncbi:MAG: hypothetical protein RLZ87_1573 [Armatimonadota bacterium]